MKFSLIGVAALMACAPVMAQEGGIKTAIKGTDLTLYGVFDAFAARYSTTAAGRTEATTEVGSGGVGGSRLGFLAMRTVNPDLTVGGRLEAGINLDSGRVGSSTNPAEATPRTDRVWSRQAYLSIASKKGGELRVGRQQGPTYQFMTQYDPILMPAIDGWGVLTTLGGRVPGDATGFYINPTIRTDNTIYYQSPEFSGFQLKTSYSGRDSRQTDKSIFDVSLNYAKGPLNASVLLLRASGTSTATDVNETALAASYDFGAIKPYVTFVQRDTTNPALTGGDDSNQRTALLGAIIPVSKEGQVRVSLGRYTNERDDRNATGVAIAYTHDVAPGFMLYGGLSFLKQDSGSRIPIFTSAVPDAGKSVNAITVGASFRF
ncbi:MAG: porin [Hydrogenophaga sp.]|uniref:porin n=1 Tax=Hydrogenophaga sp. TaxID=1904254 RepID=UPI002ABC8E74|nr:porin [Hydrogenophaga sp.]MDZ4175353.1 porin [Hydrogenophaga sp.]